MISPTVAPSEQMMLITNTNMFGQLDISGCRKAKPERETGAERARLHVLHIRLVYIRSGQLKVTLKYADVSYLD